MSKKYFETREFKALQKEWYKKAADDGFEDIEDHIEWRLKGSTAHVNLQALKKVVGHEYGAHSIEDTLDADDDTLKFNHGYAANYWQLAEQLSATAYRERRDPELCDVWRLHTQMRSERDIATDLDITRARVRAHLRVLKKSIDQVLTPPK